MVKKGRGVARAAGSIINAIVSGRGGSFGIDLKTWAEVEVNDSGRINISIEDHEHEDKYLVHRCVSKVLDTYAPHKHYGAKVITRSEIPMSRGLKSSSAASNAVIRATLDALDVDVDPFEAIKIGTRASREAGISRTGAFDDACASWFGGICLTDNNSEALLRRGRFDRDYIAIIHIPDHKIRKRDIPLHRISAWSEIMELAFGMAITRDYLRAMMINSLCISAALDLDQEVAMNALIHGAAAAGFTGTGPSTIILIKASRLDDFLNLFEYNNGEIRIVDLYNGED